MVVNVLEVCGNEMGVVSTEVMEEDWDFQTLVESQVAGWVIGTMDSSSQVVVIPHFVLVLDFLSVLAWVIFERSMTEAALHCAIEFQRVLGYMMSRLSSL